MKRNIYIPKFVAAGIRKNHRSIARSVKIFGGDTETCNGEPHTLQLTHLGHTDLFYVNRKNILRRFLEEIDDALVRGEWGVVYFHNLTFDLPVLFRDEDPMIWQNSNFKVERHGWECFVNCEKRFFAKLCKQKHKVVYIVDSFAYLPTSLDNIGKMLLPDLPKLPKPEGLGDLPLRTKEFEAYAERDAVIEEAFGKWIYAIHQKYDVRISVSLPQMASYIFRHKFLKENDVIEFPPPEVVRASIRSYHGGKNGFYCAPGVYENCSEIDLNSAYPYAMKCLPSFLKGRYEFTETYRPELCGVYNLTGEVHCPYNIFFDDAFKPVQGKFSDLWVTGYELEEALKHKEVKVEKLYGYVWVPEDDRNPLGEYVDHFYNLKNTTPKKDPMYNFYKLAMNSLYGKFIQAIEVREIENAERKAGIDLKVTEDEKGNLKVEEPVKKFNAGGLFNPFIATMITGKVRAMIHHLEHKYKAIHTATDSIKTLLPTGPDSTELGGYKLEVKGLCLILRNKLYVHFDEQGELKKYALHGFQGSVKELLDLIVSRKNDYSVNHILKVREATRLRKEALKMTKLDKSFHFNWDKFSDRGFHYWMEQKDALQKPKYFATITKSAKRRKEK